MPWSHAVAPGPVCVGVAASIFVLDLFTPRGVIEYILYIVVVLIAVYSTSTRFALQTTLGCMALTVVGFFLSPEGMENWKALLNRGFVMEAMGFVAWIGIQWQESTRELARMHAEREEKLTGALASFIPVCAWCKKVRDEQNHWQPLENYFGRRTDAQFTHGICPSCARAAEASLVEDHSGSHNVLG